MTLQAVKKRRVEKWFNRVMVRIKASSNWDMMMMMNESFKLEEPEKDTSSRYEHDR